MARGQQQQLVADHGRDRRYFTILPNLVDDSDLDPYEFRLLAHYRRVAGDAGECREFTRTTAERCRMSRRKVIDARASLQRKGWIYAETSGGHGENVVHVTLIDRWAENMTRYSPTPVHDVHTPPAGDAGPHAPGAHGGVQEMHTEEEPLQKPLDKDPTAEAVGDGAHARATAPAATQGTKDRFDEFVELVHEFQGDDFPINGLRRKNRTAINESDRPVEYLARAYIRLVLGWWEHEWAGRDKAAWQAVDSIGAYDDDLASIEQQMQEQRMANPLSHITLAIPR